MTYDRASLKAKLVQIDKERHRILTALGVLDGIDSEDRQSKVSALSSPYSKTGGMLIDAVATLLESSSEMLSVQEIYGRIALERAVSSSAVIATCLSRLKRRGKIFRKNGRYGVVVSTMSIRRFRCPIRERHG